MAAINRYIVPTLIGIILTLSALLFISHERSERLNKKLLDIQTQSDTIVMQHIRRVAEINEIHANEKIAIDSRYNSIISSLREQGDRKLPPAAGQCESEYRARASRVYTELLGIYANVAKYATQLTVNGGACESLRE